MDDSDVGIFEFRDPYLGHTYVVGTVRVIVAGTGTPRALPCRFVFRNSEIRKLHAKILKARYRGRGRSVARIRRCIGSYVYVLPESTRRNAKRKKGSEPGARTNKSRSPYVCDYCHKDLSTSLRVKCNECQDFDLCLECFAVGVEITPHRNTHGYRIIDSLSRPLYTMDWGIDEETLLLEAIERYGLHWKQVSHHVGRPSEDCKGHYLSVYVDTESFPMPCKAEEVAALTEEDVVHMIEEKRVACARRIAALKSGIKLPMVKEEEREEDRAEQTEQTDTSSRGGTPSVMAMDEDSKAGMKDTKKQKKPRKLTKAAKAKLAAQQDKAGHDGEDGEDGRSRHVGKVGNKTLAAAGAPSGTGAGAGVTEGAPLAMAESQQSGYHIKRNEFEVEYDHEAEHLIADLVFGEDDTPEQVKEKLRLIEIYNKRLDERERRKNFVLSRGLVKVKRQQLIDRRRTPAEKDLVGRLRVLARYMPHPQWESLADGLTIEARLRSRIQELQVRFVSIRHLHLSPMCHSAWRLCHSVPLVPSLPGPHPLLSLRRAPRLARLTPDRPIL